MAVSGLSGVLGEGRGTGLAAGPSFAAASVAIASVISDL
jgi:hypothetical protein